MFGDVTAPVGLHVAKGYRKRSMQHRCSRHAAWIPHKLSAIYLGPDLAPPLGGLRGVGKVGDGP